MAKKSQPLSIEDLLESQQKLLSASNLTEEQRKRAEEQIAKLEELRKATTENQEKQTEVVDQVKIMTRAKGDSRNVTLGDVRTEIKAMRKDLVTFAGTDPNPNRKPLRKPPASDIIDVEAREVSEKNVAEQQQERINKIREERVNRLSSIGSTLGEKAELYQKGAGKEVTMAKNAETFQKFVAETKKKDELLKDATEDQIKLFDRLEETLIKLRDSDAKNSVELRKELAKIAGELETTDKTAARGQIGGVLENARNRARSGARNEAGTLGDAWSVLMGKQKVMKTGGGTMNRLAGAATVAGNFFRGKVEDYNATNASNAGSSFLDRTFGSNRLEEDRARLGARADALVQRRGESPRGMAMPTAAPRSSGGSAMNVTATVVNLRGPIKMPSSGPNWSAGNAGALAGKDWPPKPTVSATTPAAVAAAATPAQETGGGFGLPDLNIMGRGKSILGRAGSGIMSAGRGILSAGKNLLGKVPGGALKGGLAGIAGLGLSYGGDKLKEAGYEKTGAAADIAGQAASWGGTGAMIGSVIPGLGTAVGAGVGAVAGGAYGLYKNWSSLFGGKKSEGDGAAVQPVTHMASGTITRPNAAPSEKAMNVATGASGFPLTAQQAAAPVATVSASKPAVKSMDKSIAKDYTQDPRYQEILRSARALLKAKVGNLLCARLWLRKKKPSNSTCKKLAH
jgi:hypothetical protein